MIPPTNAANRTNYDLIPFSVSQRPDKIASLETEQIPTSTESPVTTIKEESQRTVPSRSRAATKLSTVNLGEKMKNSIERNAVIKSGIGQSI